MDRSPFCRRDQSAKPSAYSSVPEVLFRSDCLPVGVFRHCTGRHPSARKITFQELVGAKWSRWGTIAGDLGVALATLVVMAVIGNLSNVVLGPFQHDSAAFRSFVAQNTVEALAFLGLALTAGFVEEFVFRGYLQRQFQALFGSTIVASLLQLIVFTQGHLYQGWIRLVPVFLIGVVVTIVALWRKSLIPGMVAHGPGDGLVAFIFFFKHL